MVKKRKFNSSFFNLFKNFMTLKNKLLKDKQCHVNKT